MQWNIVQPFNVYLEGGIAAKKKSLCNDKWKKAKQKVILYCNLLIKLCVYTSIKQRERQSLCAGCTVRPTNQNIRVWIREMFIVGQSKENG